MKKEAKLGVATMVHARSNRNGKKIDKKKHKIKKYFH